MSAPTLSVILPNRNHARYLGKAIEAIAAQSSAFDELIVIDDCSTDGSLAILEEAARRFPCVRILRSERNQGAHAAVGRGLAESIGTYIYLAAADDLVLPGLLARSVDMLERYPDAGFCSAVVRLMDEDGRDRGLMATPGVLPKAGFVTPARTLDVLRRHGGWFRCNTAVYRRDVLRGLGGFDPDLGSFGDAFACSIIALRQGCCFIPEPLAVMRVSSTSTSAMTTDNVDEAARIFGRAKQLMKADYRDIFPDDYVELWDGRWRYTVGTGLVARLGRDAARDVIRLFPFPNALDRGVTKMMGLPTL